MGKKGGAESSGKGGGSKDRDKEASGSKDAKLKACNQVKARHILTEKQSKILECYEILNNEGVSESKFAELATKYSEDAARHGGLLFGGDWIPRGKTEPAFQEVLFATSPKTISQPFKGANGWHIIYVIDRKS